MQDSQKARFLAATYHELQGLRLVPLGVAFLAKSTWNTWWPWINDWLLLPAVIVALVLFRVIGIYYERNFGTVQRKPAGGAGYLLTGILGVFLLFVLPAWVDTHLNPPVSVFCLGVALFFLQFHWASSGRRSHYAVVALFFASLSLLPLTGMVSVDQLFGSRSVIGDLASGLALIFGGIFDHLLLVRSLQPIPMERDVEAI